MIYGVVAIVVAAGLWWLSAAPGGESKVPVTVDLSKMTEAVDSAKEVRDLAKERSEQIGGMLSEAQSEVFSKEVAGFGEVVPMSIGRVAVWASVATTTADQVRGLSGTLQLPDDVVKLFVFATPGEQPIWMKDMRYPIDILWLDEKGVVVHVAESVSPDTYPKTFSSSEPAKYVIEAVDGFVAKHGVRTGDATVMPANIVDI